MPLLSLPNELFFCVASELTFARDFNAFVQTNRRTYSLLNDFFYRQCAKGHCVMGDDRKSTALHIAASQSCATGVEKLLEAKAPINAFDAWKCTPLVLATLVGDENMANLLLQHGASPHYRANDRLESPLDHATQKRQVNLIRKLVARGAFVDETDFCGWTSLHKAAFLGYRDVMAVLQELGADINLRLADGRTVLHRAARRQDEKAVKLLLEMGADPTVQDDAGITAADVAGAELRWFQQREGMHGRHQAMLSSQRIVRMLGGIRG